MITYSALIIKSQDGSVIYEDSQIRNTPCDLRKRSSAEGQLFRSKPSYWQSHEISMMTSSCLRTETSLKDATQAGAGISKFPKWPQESCMKKRMGSRQLVHTMNKWGEVIMKEKEKSPPMTALRLWLKISTTHSRSRRKMDPAPKYNRTSYRSLILPRANCVASVDVLAMRRFRDWMEFQTYPLVRESSSGSQAHLNRAWWGKCFIPSGRGRSFLCRGKII